MKLYVTKEEADRLEKLIQRINDKFTTIVSRKIAKAQYESMIRRIKGIRGYDQILFQKGEVIIESRNKPYYSIFNGNSIWIGYVSNACQLVVIQQENYLKERNNYI